MVKELTSFKVKITAAANETFGEWREGYNDDLVLALALGVWWGENGYYADWTPTVSRKDRCLTADVPPGVWIDDDRESEEDDL